MTDDQAGTALLSVPGFPAALLVGMPAACRTVGHLCRIAGASPRSVPRPGAIAHALRLYWAPARLAGQAERAVFEYLRATAPRRTTHRRECRVCGCTDARTCVPACYWVADTLCSRCATVAFPPTGTVE